MRDKNELDTHMLLKIILEPNIYLSEDPTDMIERLYIGGSKDNESNRYLYVDVLQFLQDNLLELAVNPRYVDYSDIKNSMTCIDELYAGKYDGTYDNNLKRVYIHFCKTLFMVNLMLIRNGYTNDNSIRLLPTLNLDVISRLNGYKSSNIGIPEWLIFNRFTELSDKFKELENSNNAWGFTVFGAVLQEFPKSINLLNRKQVFNTIAKLQTDKYLNALAQAIYLNHVCGKFIAFTNEELYDGFESEVKLIE